MYRVSPLEFYQERIMKIRGDLLVNDCNQRHFLIEFYSELTDINLQEYRII